MSNIERKETSNENSSYNYTPMLKIIPMSQKVIIKRNLTGQLKLVRSLELYTTVIKCKKKECVIVSCAYNSSVEVELSFSLYVLSVFLTEGFLPNKDLLGGKVASLNWNSQCVDFLSFSIINSL